MSQIHPTARSSGKAGKKYDVIVQEHMSSKSQLKRQTKPKSAKRASKSKTKGHKATTQTPSNKNRKQQGGTPWTCGLGNPCKGEGERCYEYGLFRRECMKSGTGKQGKYTGFYDKAATTRFSTNSVGAVTIGRLNQNGNEIKMQLMMTPDGKFVFYNAARNEYAYAAIDPKDISLLPTINHTVPHTATFVPYALHW
jgi:hypothetical protein